MLKTLETSTRRRFIEPSGDIGCYADDDFDLLSVSGSIDTPGSNPDQFAMSDHAGSLISLRADQAFLTSVARRLQAENAPTAAAFLLHFLSGSGRPLAAPLADRGSAIQRAADRSPEFSAIRNRLLAQIQGTLNEKSGVTYAILSLNSSDQVNWRYSENDDLKYAFGRTRGLDVSGYLWIGRDSGICGTLTLTISSVYGFASADAFSGGTQARFLQAHGDARRFDTSMTLDYLVETRRGRMTATLLG